MLIVEEDTLTGGWGAEVAAKLAEVAFDELDAPITRVAAPRYAAAVRVRPGAAPTCRASSGSWTVAWASLKASAGRSESHRELDDLIGFVAHPSEEVDSFGRIHDGIDHGRDGEFSLTHEFIDRFERAAGVPARVVARRMTAAAAVGHDQRQPVVVEFSPEENTRGLAAIEARRTNGASQSRAADRGLEPGICAAQLDRNIDARAPRRLMHGFGSVLFSRVKAEIGAELLRELSTAGQGIHETMRSAPA